MMDQKSILALGICTDLLSFADGAESAYAWSWILRIANSQTSCIGCFKRMFHRLLKLP